MTNIAADERETLNKEFRRAVCDMAGRFEPTLMVTLAYNRDTRPETVAKDLRQFLARMDRELLGSRWSKKGPERRTRHFSILENPRTNPHIHMLVRPADGDWWKFSKLVAAFWKKTAVSGSADVQPITHLTGAVEYVTKFITPDRAERLILAPFHVGRARSPQETSS